MNLVKKRSPGGKKKAIQEFKPISVSPSLRGGGYQGEGGENGGEIPPERTDYKLRIFGGGLT